MVVVKSERVPAFSLDPKKKLGIPTRVDAGSTVFFQCRHQGQRPRTRTNEGKVEFFFQGLFSHDFKARGPGYKWAWD